MTEALNQTIVAAVQNAIRSTLCLPDALISLETRFSEDLLLDSLDMIELTMALEETFHAEFPHDSCGRFRSVAELVTYISGRYFADDRSALLPLAA